MESLHKQEKVLQNFEFDGASAQLVEWTETLWCGKVKYAPNYTGEPDVEKLMEEFVALGEAELSPLDPEEGWDVCLSINYLSDQRPSGVFFGFQVESRRQPEGFDQLWLPGGRFLRVEINEATARALDSEPWTGGGAPLPVGQRQPGAPAGLPGAGQRPAHCGVLPPQPRREHRGLLALCAGGRLGRERRSRFGQTTGPTGCGPFRRCGADGRRPAGRQTRKTAKAAPPMEPRKKCGEIPRKG